MHVRELEVDLVEQGVQAFPVGLVAALVAAAGWYAADSMTLGFIVTG